MQAHEHDQHKNQVLFLQRMVRKQELLWIFLGSAPSEEQSQQNSLRKTSSACCCCLYIYFLSLCCPLNNQETSFRELLLTEKQRQFVSRVPGIFSFISRCTLPWEIFTLILVSLCMPLSFHHSYISIFSPNKRWLVPALTSQLLCFDCLDCFASHTGTFSQQTHPPHPRTKIPTIPTLTTPGFQPWAKSNRSL